MSEPLSLAILLEFTPQGGSRESVENDKKATIQHYSTLLLKEQEERQNILRHN